MRLQVENWIEQSEFPIDSEVAFKESVICYKAGAYRASMLFSYIGISLCIRDRVLRSSQPHGIPDKLWTTIQKSLLDDDKWDHEIFNCTQRQKPSPIFDISEDIRFQFKYWKNRRNDCAHYKQNAISSSHTEMIWDFAMSNLGKFHIIGSDASLLGQIEKHFDTNFTPVYTDITGLVSQIPASVENSNYPEFVSQVSSLVEYKAGSQSILDENKMSFFLNGCMKINDPQLEECILEYLKSKGNFPIHFILKYPHNAQIFNNDLKFVRTLWHNEFFKTCHSKLKFSCILLKNNLIPSNQIVEFFNYVVVNLTGEIPSEEDNTKLSSSGFWDVFYKFCFVNCKIDQFKWGNRNAQLICWYVENMNLNVELVKVVSEIFQASPYPNDVCKTLREMFKNNDSKSSLFKSIADENEIDLPDPIFRF